MGIVRFFTSNEELLSLEDPFDETKVEFFYKEELGTKKDKGTQYCLVELETSIPVPLHSKFIASRLDSDINLNVCRLAFHGVILPINDFSNIHVFKMKEREANVDRIVDSRNIIGKNLIKKGQDISKFIGLSIEAESGQIGKIESSFGSSGKFKVGFSEDIPKDLKLLKLKYKINIFDENRKWFQ
jgi:selenocysteine-specific elongation factor